MKRWLVHPALAPLRPGSKEWFAAQGRMIEEKPLVRRCYELWYRKLLADADSVPGDRDGGVVELGSGQGYVKRIRPSVLTSDVEPGAADLVIDGRSLPFADGSVRALLLAHVFHHIPDVRRFLGEAVRVLAPGGVIALVDETHTPFARLFFARVHPEPYDDAAGWEFPEGRSLLASNQALSWIVFRRDRARFEAEFPALRLEACEYLPWFGYLLSGGVNLRSLVPRPAAPLVALLDRALRPADPLCAIHWHLRIRKQAAR